MDPLADDTPGSVLRRIYEESTALEAYIDLLKRRMELDKKYTDDLKILIGSVVPQWPSLPALSLVSPMLQHFQNEIQEREAAYQSITRKITRASKFETLDIPDTHREWGIKLMEYEELLNSRRRYKECYKKTKTKEALHAMEKWRSRMNVNYHMLVQDGGKAALPDADLDYRRSIDKLQKEATKIANWHNETLPGIVEMHQTRLEDVKVTTNHVLNGYSNMATNIVNSLSNSKHSVAEFSTSRFIAPIHEAYPRELDHDCFQSVQYQNDILGLKIPRVVFGLPGSLETIDTICHSQIWSTFNNILCFKFTFQDFAHLERELSAYEDMGVARGTFSTEETQKSLFYAFVSNPPLIPLSDAEVTRYKGGIRRSKLHHVMEPYRADETKRRTLHLISRKKTEFDQISVLLTDKFRVPELVVHIWCKWDILNHRPYPKDFNLASRVSTLQINNESPSRLIAEPWDPEAAT